MPSDRKEFLLARNAELRAELTRELVAVRTELAPALHWFDQAQAGVAWARERAPMLAGVAALVGTLLLRRRRRAAPTAQRQSLLLRLWRLGRLAMTVGGVVSSFIRPGTQPAPSGRSAAPSPRRSS